MKNSPVFFLVCSLISISVLGQNTFNGSNYVSLNGNHHKTDIKQLVCYFGLTQLPGEEKSVSSFINSAIYCIEFLNKNGSIKFDSTIYRNIYQIQNCRTNDCEIDFIIKVIDSLEANLSKTRIDKSTYEYDAFLGKFDQTKAYKLLSCFRDQLKLKMSTISKEKYFEFNTDSSNIANTLEVIFFPMKNGIRRVKINEKYGYTYNDSVFILEPVFSNAWDISEGLILAGNGREFRFFDEKGNVVLVPNFKFIEVYPFSNGLARVREENRGYNYIDKTGKIKFNTWFYKAADFKKDKAAVEIAYRSYRSHIKENKKIYGKTRIKSFEKATYHSVSVIEDAPIVGRPSDVQVEHHSYSGYITLQGYFTTPPNYAGTYSFNENGYAVVVEDNDRSFCPEDVFSHQNYITYLIDTNFQRITQNYYLLKEHKNTLTVFQCNYCDSTIAIFNSKGILIKDCFKGFANILNEFIIIEENGKYGLLSISGVTITKPIYDNIEYQNTSIFNFQKGNIVSAIYINPSFELKVLKESKVQE